MKRLSMMVLWIVIGWATVAGCAIAPESAEPVPLQPQNAGDGTCSGGVTTCWKYTSAGTTEYGACLADGSCCYGCVDEMGVCHGIDGSGSATCGTWGAFCNNGLTCRGDSGAGSCKNGICCPPPSTDPDSGLPVGKDCGNL